MCFNIYYVLVRDDEIKLFNKYNQERHWFSYHFIYLSLLLSKSNVPSQLTFISKWHIFTMSLERCRLHTVQLLLQLCTILVRTEFVTRQSDLYRTRNISTYLCIVIEYHTLLVLFIRMCFLYKYVCNRRGEGMTSIKYGTWNWIAYCVCTRLSKPT